MRIGILLAMGTKVVLAFTASAGVLLGADDYRPAPRFEGKAIPDPPRQKEPWTPPETKLPRFLVSATKWLFEAGMADPRGCEYREVEIGQAGRLVTIRAFVLPEVAGEPRRFAVGWDGVVYPAFKVGAAADVEADLRALAASMAKARAEAAKSDNPFLRRRNGFGVSWEQVSAGAGAVSPLKIPLLLRIGRADLAESLFAAGTAWTPEAPRRDLTDYGITFLTLAGEWANDGYQRLVTAHVRGDDAVALDAARRLSAFDRSIAQRGEALGLPRSERRPDAPPGVYFANLRQLPVLLADQERRAAEPTRAPIPPRGGDPTARIAALIRDFDQIHVQQMMSPGSAHPGEDGLVREVVREGDAAVGPLLLCLESDMRLTRTANSGRSLGEIGDIHPVYEAALSALLSILKTHQFQQASYALKREDTAGRKRLAAEIRAFWEKNRNVPIVDRWYRALADDRAGPGPWLEAANGIISTSDPDAPPTRPRRPGESAPMQGEPLREGREPGVSALMARRTAELIRRDTGGSFDLNSAYALAAAFASWDLPASLPSLRDLMKRCIERTPAERDGQPGYAQSIAQLAVMRVRGGDLAALDEYAAWIRAMTPKSLEYVALAALEPMWQYPDRPSIAEAARAMFADPKSPWIAASDAAGGARFGLDGLVASPLVRLDAFRDGLIVALGDRTVVGTAQREKIYVRYARKDGSSGSAGVANIDPPGPETTFRRCDDVANRLSALEGSPACEIYWPEDRRDRAVSECVAYLKRYGKSFTAQPPPGEHDFPNPRVHLAFPKLGRPATPEDVGAARAIFSLAGEGGARVVPLPSHPMRAKWVTLKEFPFDQTYGNDQTRREYDQDGWVWQAEEVEEGGRTARYYGFVGRRIIARAPAADIELPLEAYRSRPLTNGWDVLLELVDPPDDGYAPGRPVPARLTLRNRSGLDRDAPTEFAREADGRLALRRGMRPAAFFVPPEDPTRVRHEAPLAEETREPADLPHFEPEGTKRRLGPGETAEVASFDLARLFDLSTPGIYRILLRFDAGSSLGEGQSDQAYVRILPRAR